MDELPELPPNAFVKSDSSPDDLFYAAPRFVTHIDGNAIAAVMALYRELFPPGGVILDLMSSWISHLPRDTAYGRVIGHGMNAAELAANSQLTSSFVQNLNENVILPLDQASVDAAAICVSVQYLQNPIAVFQELARVLKPGGPVAITFSNRCFPTKAVAIWQALDDDAHARLVALYLERAGFAPIETRELVPPARGLDPLWAVIGGAPK
ncbi:methyltransferase domain-containing protein [Methylocapsa polymorpha]|uniref:Methyltransferase domain-containing protein n=1 Tax=Methylocapsa polymorpha TaxID=3080828 RepID=A0ABZ0HTQ5_9HYPH|nr:methyltransferase domain-containing protein [Methylocapsa sp. RX1]